MSESTNYNILVKATNEFGTVQATIVFTTAELTNLQLKKYIYSSSNSLKIIYNEDNQVNIKYLFESLETTYAYDNGQIISEDYHHPVRGRLDADYNYNANQELVQLTTVESYSHGYTSCTFNFESKTNYAYTQIVFSQGGNGGNTQTFNYSIILTLNMDGNIVKYESRNIDTSELKTTTFEYTNDNITKLVTPEGKVLEIIYDNKKSFHTYKSRYPRGFHSANDEIIDVAGFIYIDNIIDIYLATRYIPQFYDHLNKNNPLEYKLDGQVKTTFEYEYNENNYPSSLKANFANGTSTGVVNLIYEEI